MVHIKHSTRCLAHGSVYTITYVCGLNYHNHATHFALIFILSSLVKDQPEGSGRCGEGWMYMGKYCHQLSVSPGSTPETSWGGGKVWGGRGFLVLPAPLGVSQALVAAIILSHLEVLWAEAEGPDRASPHPAGLRAGVHPLGWGPP